jgi:hypothetical protein
MITPELQNISRKGVSYIKRYLLVRIDPRAEISSQDQLCQGYSDVLLPGNKAVVGSVSSSGH